MTLKEVHYFIFIIEIGMGVGSMHAPCSSCVIVAATVEHASICIGI